MGSDCVQINLREPGSQPSEGAQHHPWGCVSCELWSSGCSNVNNHALLPCAPDCQNSFFFFPPVFFRESLDKLSQRGQLLSEEGHGAGKESRLCSQLLTSYQNLLRMTKEKLRGCQVALQEHEALEEALQSMWSWVKDMQDRLASAESTVGSKDALERRLLQVQVHGAPAWGLRKTAGLDSGVWGVPGGSDSKESACNAGDLGLTPGRGRSPGEGNGYPLQ